MSYTFIDSDLHDTRKLLSLARELLVRPLPGCRSGRGRTASASARPAYQASIDLAETINSVGRPTVPVYHTEQWYVYSLLASAKGIAPVLYGERAGPATSGAGWSTAPAARVPVYSWACPVARSI